MEPALVGAFFLALAATPGAAREVVPYEVVYHATVSESLCALLPGHPMKFDVLPSNGTKGRMEISCDEKGLKGAPEVELKFWLDTLPYPHIIYFRWGRDVAAAPSRPWRGQFQADPSLCEKAKKIIEEVAVGGPRNLTVRLKDATLTAKCNGDDLWGTSLEFHLDLTLNEPEPPSTPTTRLPKSP